MSRRRELLFCAAAAAALVLVRSIVPTVYEGFYFDSDQAIVGLMAKRASAFQEFPLFYSGLNYILAVEAWIITPFFWLARPSVAVMRLPLIVLNVLVAVWLVVAISRPLGLNDADVKAAVCPSSAKTGSPVGTSQTRAVLSRLPVTMRLPSCEKAAHRIASPCPLSVRKERPVAASQTLAVLSWWPVTSRLPSGE